MTGKNLTTGNFSRLVPLIVASKKSVKISGLYFFDLLRIFSLKYTCQPILKSHASTFAAPIIVTSLIRGFQTSWKSLGRKRQRPLPVCLTNRRGSERSFRNSIGRSMKMKEKAVDFLKFLYTFLCVKTPDEDENLSKETR